MTKLPINFRSRASKCPIYGLLPISTPLFRPLPIHIMGTAGPGCKDWPVPDARPRPDPCPTAGPAPTPRAQTRVGPARQGRGAVTAPDQRRRAPPRIQRASAPFPRSHAPPSPSAPPPASPRARPPPRSPAHTPHGPPDSPSGLRISSLLPLHLSPTCGILAVREHALANSGGRGAAGSIDPRSMTRAEGRGRSRPLLRERTGER